MHSDSSWRYSISTSIGRRHINEGRGSDDAGVCWTLSANGQEYLIVAVADGAGSAKNAAEGAAIVTSAIASLLRQHLIQGGSLEEIDDRVIDGWLAAVRREVQDAADLATEAKSSLHGLKDYNATLLFAVVGDSHAVLCQIGDGAIVVDEPEGRWQLAFEPQHGPAWYPNRRGHTNFVTSDRFEQKREIVHLVRRVSKIALFTDGVEHAALSAEDLRCLPGSYSATSRIFYEPKSKGAIKVLPDLKSMARHDFFDNAFEVVAADASPGMSASASQKFQDFLDSEHLDEVTGDDKCLILACRLA